MMTIDQNKDPMIMGETNRSSSASIGAKSSLVACRNQMYRKKKTVQVEEMTMDKCLQDLNAEQKRAVTCSIRQSALVLSGAGPFLCSQPLFLSSTSSSSSRQW